MQIDIVMLTLTNTPELYDMTCRAIDSLHKSEDDITFNVILVESSKEWTHTQYPYKGITVVSPWEEFNYNKFCKIGLGYCKNEWVALCNNDLIFHKGWMTEILKSNQVCPEYQSFTPWNPYQQWHDRCMVDGFSIYEGYRTSYEVGGWCLVTKKSLLDQINLDDRVNFWYSDNVYIDEMRKIGVRHALVRESKVSHICSATSKTLSTEEFEQITVGQQRPYMEGR